MDTNRVNTPDELYEFVMQNIIQLQQIVQSANDFRLQAKVYYTHTMQDAQTAKVFQSIAKSLNLQLRRLTSDETWLYKQGYFSINFHELPF